MGNYGDVSYINIDIGVGVGGVSPPIDESHECLSQAQQRVNTEEVFFCAK